MMYRLGCANTFVAMFFILNVYQVAHSLSSDERKDALLFGSDSRAKAKTDCNCSLDAKKLTVRFNSDDIAVSFTVTVKISNSTSRENSIGRFVLVRNLRAMFLLELPDDSEILSLTTLRHSVQTSNIVMYPVNNSNCFNKIPRARALCQDKVIVATFYNTQMIKQGIPICFPPVNEKDKADRNIVYRCCTWREGSNFGYVNCSMLIYQNTWVAYAILAAQVGSAILFIMTPLLFKYLPTRDTQVRRSRATGPRHLGYSTFLATPVDSVTTNRKLLSLVEPLSFITCGGDEAQACFSRLCRVIAILIFPLIFCVFVLIFYVNNNNTVIRTNITYYTGLVGFLKPSVEYYVFGIALFCILLLGMLVLIPGRLSGLGKALSGRKDERTFLGFPKPEQFINNLSGKTGFQFMQSNMVFHLKCCSDIGFWLFILKVILAPCAWLLLSCCCPARDRTPENSEDADEDHEPPKICLILGLVFLPVIMAVWIPFVLLCFVTYVTPIGYVGFKICRLLYSQDIPVKCDCCERLPFCIRLILVSFLYCIFLLFCTSVLGSYIFLTLMFGVFFYILAKVFLYTLIGLGFNVQFFIPYTVVAFFGVFYIWRTFSHYLSVYENLRIVLFEECEKYEQQEPMNVHQTISPSDSTSSVSSQAAAHGLLLLDNNNTPSIPLNLYVAAYRRLRPRGKTFFTVVIKLLLTLVYLSIAFAAIMSLNDAQNTSTYVQAVFLCATFALPLLLFHGGSSYAKRRRKELEYQVRFIIHRYVSKVGSNQEATADNTTGEAAGSVEFIQPNNDLLQM